jgi:PAS domain S-box-containing protein
MHPAIPLAALGLVSASAMACYVALRREKTELHWLLLALLVSLVVWTAGVIFRFSVASPAGLEAALRLVFLGVFTTPPLWVLVAVVYARPGGALERRGVWVALGLPSALAYLALLTNEAHHLVVREVSFEVMEAGGRVWGGPIFWVFIAWAYSLVFVGALLYLRSARRMVATDERRRGVLLAVASVIPLAASALYLFQLVPLRFDLTPTALSISTVLLCVAVFRYRLFESLPLARRDVIEHLRDGVVMASGAGVILDLNPAAEGILGRDAREVRGLSLGDVLGVFGEEESGKRLCAVLASLSAGNAPFVSEVRTADQRLVEVSVASVRADLAEPAGWFVVLRDRTEERRFERVTRHTEKLQSVGTLAAGIAHEVNNPLAFIRANLSQIYRMGERVEACHAERDPDAKLAEDLADLREIAEETLDGIGRIERIVAGMRRLVASGEQSFQRVDVNEVVRDALRLSNLSRDVHVVVETRLADGLPPVEGTPERLVQAVLNLLVNARQALEGRSGCVRVETRCDGSSLEIRVGDDGPGIAEEIQGRIFDPFFTTKDPDQGTGLGLAIAFDIVRDHGGELEVRSKPGAGACFIVCLPHCGPQPGRPGSNAV